VADAITHFLVLALGLSILHCHFVTLLLRFLIGICVTIVMGWQDLARSIHWYEVDVVRFLFH
jgi:hypothetical protein